MPTDIMFKVDLVPSAENYLKAVNSAAGDPALLTVEGTDTNIGIEIETIGTGPLSINAATAQPIIINSGTALQHTTILSFPNVADSITYTFPDESGTLILDTAGTGGIDTSPPPSQSSSLAIGTAYQNTLGYDVVITVYLAVSSATTANILLGVGPTNTPTQQTIISGLSLIALGIIPIPIYLPNNYYALLSTTGTISLTISGQQAMPV